MNIKHFNFQILVVFFLFSSYFSMYNLCDAPKNWQIGFQDPATPIMEGIIDFHNHLMFFLILILSLVCWILLNIVYFNKNKEEVVKFSHGALLEIVWTLIPTIILMIIAVPSFALLYSMENNVQPFITVKAIGHQWYWSYEYSSGYRLGRVYEFDAYMVDTDDLQPGQFRLLECYHRLVLPVNEHIRILVFSQDVIHSWAVPSFGIKIDAIPGRINQVTTFIKRVGKFYGQCSEICGVNHGFMPIAVATLNLEDYLFWQDRVFNYTNSKVLLPFVNTNDIILSRDEVVDTIIIKNIQSEII